MNKIAQLSIREREELFHETASRDGRFNPVIAEYDTYRLLELKDKLGIDFDNLALLSAVREHKKVFFKSSWANYDTAVNGSLRVAPPENRRSEIAEDYRLTLRDLLYGHKPTLDDIIEKLDKFERKFNTSTV